MAHCFDPPFGADTLRLSLSTWRGTEVLFVEGDAATPNELDLLNSKLIDREAEFLTWIIKP
jgi:hypothetical protein